MKENIYNDFYRGWIYSKSVPAFSKEWFITALGRVWGSKQITIDWVDMENMQVDILNSNLPDSEKINLLEECIDAYTKRGHFMRPKK